MIYPWQQTVIDYITEKYNQDPKVEALLITGSIAHDFNNEHSDVDINMVVSNEVYESLKNKHMLTYYEPTPQYHEGGYIDGKFITLDYLGQVAKQGNEPTRFALADSIIAFDKTNKVRLLLDGIGLYNAPHDNAIRFLSQLEAWNWYCGEAIKRDNKYLLDVTVSKLILFAGRLILLHNKLFFPYHKWFLRVLQDAEKKPDNLMVLINNLLADKSPHNVSALYNEVKNYYDWADGKQFNWSSYFLEDIETLWLRNMEFIENI